MAGPPRCPVGGTIRSQRIRLGLSQQKLADMAGINRVNLSRIELGVHKRPHRLTLKALGEILNITLEVDNEG